MFPLICLALSSVATSSAEQRFATFKARYGRSYTSAAEESRRLTIFRANLDFISQENAKGLTYTLGIGPFADLTEAEFIRKYTGRPTTETQLVDEHHLGEHDAAKVAPRSMDWTSEGAVTPVKDQGSCGSCWSFSSTGVLEGAYAVKTGTLLSLSEQELVDCMMVNKTTGVGKGCGGGWPYNAMKYAASNDFCTEDSYPYTAKDGKCALEQGCTVGLKAGTVRGYVNVPKNESGLVSAVGQLPVSITVKAEKNMQHYKSGVLSVPCNGSSINHAVLAVGYGFDSVNRTSYYKVKNSWGVSYGDGGYFKMARDDGVNSNCLYNDSPVYPVLA